MTRGLGATQRKLLETLNASKDWWTAAELAVAVYGCDPPTRSQLKATERALHAMPWDLIAQEPKSYDPAWGAVPNIWASRAVAEHRRQRAEGG